MTNNDTTTDDFAEAARNAAWENDRHPDDTGNWSRMKFVRGAEWARDHLAAQEPTDAEIEAAAQAICEGVEAGDLDGWGPKTQWMFRRAARAALSAARKA